jgi:hypothetical protein
MMSTNRSVGSQPGLKSRPPCRSDVEAGRILTPRPLWLIAKGPAGKNAEYEKKEKEK